MALTKRRKLGLILITPILLLLAHYLAMLPHEYAHSFAAWIFGYKSNPLALNYGDISWSNILLLSHVDENVDYVTIFSSGHGFHGAFIAFAGAGIANVLMFILSLWLLAKKSVKKQPYLYYFLYLFNLMNLGNFFDYIPIRTFAPRDDVANFLTGLSISPWWVYIIGGYIVAILIWHFFTRTMILAYINLGLTMKFKVALMILSVGILFAFYGLPGFFGYGDIAYFLSMTSVICIPGVIAALWPTREWVIRQIKVYQ